jgi:hypothetical protein
MLLTDEKRPEGLALLCHSERSVAQRGIAIVSTESPVIPSAAERSEESPSSR